MLEVRAKRIDTLRMVDWRRWPTLVQLWPLAVVTLVALRVQLTPVLPNDFWWHLAMGRAIVAQGGVPQFDAYSYTQAGQLYYNQPWLAQLLMYLIYRLGDVAALQLFQATMIAGTFAVLYRLCRNAAGPALAAATTLGGAALGMDNWHIRPQSYALPLFVFALFILERWRRHERTWLWCLPILMLIWVNLHGTWVLLLLLCGLYLTGALIEHVVFPLPRRQSWQAIGLLMLVTLMVSVTTALNPRGLDVWRYVFNLVGNDAVRQLVPEWTSAWNDLRSPTTIGFGLTIVGVAALLVRRRQRISIMGGLCLLCFGGLAVQSVRNIMWWGIVAAPLVAALLSPTAVGKARRRIEIMLLNRLIAGGLLLMVVLTVPWWKEALGLPAPWGKLIAVQTPVRATEQLKQLPQPPKRLFHSLETGSYLIWAAPEQAVYVDPRIELYPYEQWQDYIALNQGRDIDRLGQRYGFDGWLVDRAGQATLLGALDRNPRWQRVFATDEAVYFGPSQTTVPK